MGLNKEYIFTLMNYLPGLIILAASLFALNASVIVSENNEKLSMMLQQNSAPQQESVQNITSMQDSNFKQDDYLYWSVWALGLTGFVLVLMNADRLRKMNAEKNKKEDALKLLEKQIADIKKAKDEKTELQDQLHQAQKLEAVGRLAGGIAHDFNNILAAMNGYAEFLIDDLDKTSPQHGFANNILSAGKQARELIDKMLAFSRRERKETQQMLLSDAINQTVPMLTASLSKSIELDIQVKDTSNVIHGNPTLVSQALMNLCVNAGDAMNEERGEIMIALQKADFDCFEGLDYQQNLPATDDLPLVSIEDISPSHTRLNLGKIAKDQDYLCLSVSDSGSGMGRKVMEKIFEPFFTTKPVDKGTGLGLAMVHGVVASHRGCMQINSTLGKGTRFDIFFPSLGERTTHIETKDLEQKEWDAFGHILLVEDQDDVRVMMRTMLERIGFDVEDCDGGLAALEILREHPDYFSAVITDQNMPKMTGIELIEQVAIDNPDIPFIVVTGYSLEALRDIMTEHPSIRAILRKPIDREKLKEAVQKASLEKQFAA
ncbi:MAG: response regulator [Bdellovibrionales bacterium]